MRVKTKIANWKKNALTIGIAILYLLFIALVIEAFYPHPQYPKYSDYVTAIHDTPEYEEQYKAYEDAQKVYTDRVAVYNRNVFIIAIIAGTLSIVIGAVIIPSVAGAVGSGLMYGGILTIIYGTLRYFSDMGKILRVVVVGIALLILIWVGLKKLSEKEQK